MSGKFYFYVSKGAGKKEDEFFSFSGKDELKKIGKHVKYSKENFAESIMAPRNTHLANGIKERVVWKLKHLWDSLISTLLYSKRTVNVVVVYGEGFTEKKRVLDEYERRSRCGSMCEKDYHDLGELMLEYFKKLATIGRRVYVNEMLGDWRPESVTVITHWGCSGVGKIEEDLAMAVSSIADEQFKKWRTVASSSTRKEAFPKGFNPFVNAGDAAKLPTAAVCEILEMKLPLAGKIDWDDAEKTTDEAKLKRYYDRLMLKLNH